MHKHVFSSFTPQIVCGFPDKSLSSLKICQALFNTRSWGFRIIKEANVSCMYGYIPWSTLLGSHARSFRSLFSTPLLVGLIGSFIFHHITGCARCYCSFSINFRSLLYFLCRWKLFVYCSCNWSSLEFLSFVKYDQYFPRTHKILFNYCSWHIFNGET